MHAGIQQPPLLSPLTQEALGQLQIHLPALKLVSYRGPGLSGGVVSSLSPLTKQLGTKVHWVALTGVPSGEESNVAGFSFHRADVNPTMLETNSRAVYEYLWPLVHGLVDRATFDPDAWRSFRQLSQSLANQALRVSSRSYPTLVWLHDFEMALVPPLLGIDAGVIVSHFWHAPWPAAEVIANSPVGTELVDSLLANSLLGFHTKEYAANFLATVGMLHRDAQVDLDNMTVSYRGHVTHVVAMPLGLDLPYWQRLAKTSRVESESLGAQYRLAQQVIIGVDRLDYTKGLLEKLAGIEAFLDKYPSQARRFHYVQLAQPLEFKSQAMSDYVSEVNRRVQEINKKYGTDGWEPIVWFEAQFSQADLAAWYQAADVLAVTPVRDGLNLIAKEYVACRMDEQGSVVLSKNAGAADELLSGALLIDPSSPEEIADAFAQALAMGVEEKRRRMVSMRHVVGWNRLHDWACGFLHNAIKSAELPVAIPSK